MKERDAFDDENNFWHLFSLPELVHAMAPAEKVIACANQTNSSHSKNDNNSPSTSTNQDFFASVLQTACNDPYPPSRSYLCHLLKLYVKTIGDETIESELLMELVMTLLLSSSSSNNNNDNSGLPNQMDYCYMSFWLAPTMRRNSIKNHNNDNGFDKWSNKSPLQLPLRLRVFPKHQDVALRLWEGGAALAELLLLLTMQQQQRQEQQTLENGCCSVEGKDVVELGGGVGATALVAAGCCGASHVHCTDYTPMCLENLRHNEETNQAWLQQAIGYESESSSPRREVVSVGRLDWTWFDPKENDVVDDDDNARNEETQRAHCQERQRLIDAQVLLAADVAYDRSVLTSLANTIHFFLSNKRKNSNTKNGDEEKFALLATTRRNLETFQMLQDNLAQRGIESERVHTRGGSAAGTRSSGDESDNDSDAVIAFPCQFHQPRSDVWFTRLTLSR